jgi:surface antigen
MEKRMASKRGHRKALPGGIAAAILCLAPSLGWSADDPRDAAFLEPVLQRVLETARTDVETPWRNPETGNGGSIVVERTFYREPARPCRAYVRTLEAAGAAPQVTRGTGCRGSTGLWLIEEEPESLAGPQPRATPSGRTASPPTGAEPEALAEIGPSCPDTVLVPMPARRPPTFAYTLPSRAEL